MAISIDPVCNIHDRGHADRVGILRFAHDRLGIPPRYVLGFLLLSLLGSAINVPVAQFPPEKMVSGGVVNYFGVLYVVPVVRQSPGTILAVNVGGALIPVLLSAYLLIKKKEYLRSLVAVAAVAYVTHLLSHPVRGIGISIPTFVPPIVAAGTALALGWRHAPAVSYIAGTMGTLIGADLLNLDKIPGLGAPVASIGGAGTFDGIFVTGILAVVLSAIAVPPKVSQLRNDVAVQSDSAAEL